MPPDAGVAALTALTAAKGAFYNILINSGSTDPAFKDDIRSRAKNCLPAARKRSPGWRKRFVRPEPAICPDTDGTDGTRADSEGSLSRTILPSLGQPGGAQH